jgi:hypothetical protein
MLARTHPWPAPAVLLALASALPAQLGSPVGSRRVPAAAPVPHRQPALVQEPPTLPPAAPTESVACDTHSRGPQDIGGTDFRFCPNDWSQGCHRRAAIIVHELSHEHAGTNDEFYDSQPANPLARDEETSTLRKNADTCEEFVLEGYLP